MSETAIVPYRVTASTAIQPIDLALIPNENQAEQSRIETQLSEIWNDIGRMRGARAKRAVKRTFKRLVLPTLGILLTLALTGVAAISTVGPIALLTLISMPIAAAIGHEMELPPGSGIKQLRQRQESLYLRQSKLKSLDRLTGNSDRARQLLDEARIFNKDLANLDGETCTRKDANLIEEKRSAILTRIGEFRGKVLELPGDTVPLLAAGTDDRA
jgi:hypothetical protein